MQKINKIKKSKAIRNIKPEMVIYNEMYENKSIEHNRGRGRPKKEIVECGDTIKRRGRPKKEINIEYNGSVKPLYKKEITRMEIPYTKELMKVISGITEFNEENSLQIKSILEFDRFLDLVSSGIYNIDDVILKLGIDYNIINKWIQNPKYKKLFNDAIESSMVRSREKLLNRALISLDKSLSDQTLQDKFYIVDFSGNTILKNIKEHTKPIEYNAVRDVINNFSPLFLEGTRLDELTTLFIKFNDYLKTTDIDLDLLEKVVNYEHDFIKLIQSKKIK